MLPINKVWYDVKEFYENFDFETSNDVPKAEVEKLNFIKHDDLVFFADKLTSKYGELVSPQLIKTLLDENYDPNKRGDK